MKPLLVPLSCLLFLASATAAAQPASGPAARLSVDLFELIETLGAEMNREFIVDQRLSGSVGATTAAGDADYESLLGILRNLGYVAVDSGEQVRIVPETVARSLPSPVLLEDDRRISDHTIVTRVFEVGYMPVTTLIPTLRPMLPQTAHLAGIPDTNKLIIVDHYDNVRRMTAVLAAIGTAAGND